MLVWRDAHDIDGWLDCVGHGPVPACGTAVAQDFRSGLSAYNSGDYTRAFREWLGLAEQGDAAAEAGIGFLFHKGLGVTQDDARGRGVVCEGRRTGPGRSAVAAGDAVLLRQGRAAKLCQAFAWCDIAGTNGQSDASECRDVALEHMTADETAQSFKIVTDWLGRHHNHPGALRRRTCADVWLVQV